VRPPSSLVWGVAREGVGESQFRRGDLHCGTQYIYVLCGCHHAEKVENEDETTMTAVKQDDYSKNLSQDDTINICS
jgi:hypothetical protein